DSKGQLLAYYGDVAVNDDQFEGTDSSLLDLKLPGNDVYIVEVDTFRHEFAGSTPDMTGLTAEVRDAVLDTDVGQYELLVYTFGTANTSDGLDTLLGGLGQDFIDGGPGDSYALSFELGAAAKVNQRANFTRNALPFADRGSEAWTATVAHGDGGGVPPLTIESVSR